MRAVNLLPRDEGRARSQPGAVLLTAVLGSVLLTAVLCGWFMMASSGVSDKQAQLDGAKATLLAIPPAVGYRVGKRVVLEGTEAPAPGMTEVVAGAVAGTRRIPGAHRPPSKTLPRRTAGRGAARPARLAGGPSPQSV